MPTTPTFTSQKKAGIEQYKKFMDPLDPYPAYNNTDRFLNAAYRYYTTGGLEALYRKNEQLNLRLRTDYQFESQTNNLSQYFWASRGLLGVGYNVNRASLNATSSDTSDWAKVVLTRAVVNAFLETSLLIANIVRWQKPLFGTGTYTPAVPGVHRANAMFDDPDDIFPGAMEFNIALAQGPIEEIGQIVHHHEGGMIVDHMYGAADTDSVSVVGSSRAAFFDSFVSAGSQRSVLSPSAGRFAQNFVKFRPLIKNVRTYAGVMGSTGFALNAMASVAVQAHSLDNAIYAKNNGGKGPYADGGEAAIAITSAIISLTGAVFNVLANASKAADSWGKTMVINGLGQLATLTTELDHLAPANNIDFGGSPRMADGFRRYAAGQSPTFVRRAAAPPLKVSRWDTLTSKRLGYAGSAFGLVNGIAGMATLFPYLFSKNLSPEQKGVIGAEMALQLASGIGQFGAEIWLARAVANPRYVLASAQGASKGSRFLRLAGPAGLAVGSAALLLASPLQIYDLVQQGKYANQLADLHKETSLHGYNGNSLLADFYHQKNTTEAVVFAVSSALDIAALVAVGIAVASGGLATPIALGIGLAVAVVNLSLYAATQHMVEGAAEDARKKLIIDAGGDLPAFFEKNLTAQRSLLLAGKDAQNYVKSLQAYFHVDSVVGVASYFATAQALDLAATTRETEALVLGKAYGNRFDKDGKGLPGNEPSIDQDLGLMTLGGEAGKTQLLTFLLPLLAPGKESQFRIERKSNNYFTGLSLLPTGSAGSVWTIQDGAASSTMDLRNVVSSVLNLSYAAPDPKYQFKVSMQVYGKDGDDTVIAGVAGLSFDGGNGADTVDYRYLDGTVSIVARRTAADTMSVNRTMRNVDAYREVDNQKELTVGTRIEGIVTREVQSVKHALAWASDVLVNVDRIYGGDGDDVMEGGAPDETFNGDAGNDSLSGGGGNDMLIGGVGNDILAGGEGSDVLLGGAGTDSLDGGAGDDLILQHMERGNDTLDGGADNLLLSPGSIGDVLDYSVSGMAGSVVADLGKGTVTKVLAGTSVSVGVTGRYIRIYHTDATPVLSLTGLKVFAGGKDVAEGRSSVIGADGGGV